MDYLFVVLQYIIPLAALFLTAFLVFNTKGLIKAIESKTGFDISEDIENKAIALVKAGVLKAELWATTKVGAGEEKPSGPQKLDQALNFVKTEAEEHGLNEWVEKKGEDLAELVEEQVKKVL